jgi:predicted secreted protein
MAMLRRLLASGLISLLAHPAFADPPEPAVLHLTQTAEQRLPRDLLHAELRAEKTGADPQSVEAAINQSMAKALSQARQVPGVKVGTGSYSVYRDASQKDAAAWTGSQSLVLTGSDSASLLKLAGALQSAGLVMSNLAYEASPEAVRGAEDVLTAEALAALERRAGVIAEQLHLSVLRYRDLTVGNAQTSGGPMPRLALAAAGSMPAPVAAPGEATVSVTVNADILLAAKQS